MKSRKLKDWAERKIDAYSARVVFFLATNREAQKYLSGREF